MSSDFGSIHGMVVVYIVYDVRAYAVSSGNKSCGSAAPKKGVWN